MGRIFEFAWKNGERIDGRVSFIASWWDVSCHGHGAARHVSAGRTGVVCEIRHHPCVRHFRASCELSDAGDLPDASVDVDWEPWDQIAGIAGHYFIYLAAEPKPGV